MIAVNFSVNRSIAYDSKPDVAILMAVHNGARYLSEQINSVVAQTWPHWHLHVRDDASQDATVEIVARFAKKYPDRIRLVPSDGERRGANGNFCSLLESTQADYFMFCDQDDVWLPHKVERSMECMRLLETQSDPGTPLLVHTDLRVVDEDLRELDNSVWHYGYHNPELCTRLNRLLVQNMVFGCTTLINAALKDYAVPIPPGVVQYDWWLALVAVCFGRIAFLREPTALYRQHTRNTVGAQRWGVSYILEKVSRLLDLANGPLANLAAGQNQAGLLRDRYGDRLSPTDKEMIQAYANLSRLGFFARRRALFQFKFFKVGFVRNLAVVAFV